VVGVVLDYNGSLTADGFLVERSALLAAELIGQERLDQLPFELSFQNARGRPDEAERCAHTLIAEGALAVLGPSTDGLVEALGAPLREADVLLVSPTATTGLESDSSNPWVRMSPGNSSGSSAATLFGESLAKSLLDRDVRQIDVLVDNDHYDGDFARAFIRTFSELGGAASSVPVPSASSVPAAAQAILRNETGAQGYVLALELLLAAKVITEVAVAQPQAVPWFLTSRLKSEQLLANTPPGALDLAIGVSPRIAAAHDGCDPARPRECFLQAYQERWDDSPSDEAYFMYDASAVLLIALDRLLRVQAERPTRQQVMSEILAIAARGGVQIGWNDFAAAHEGAGHVQYVGLTGPLILDPDGTRRSGNTISWHVEGERIVNDYE
jgi:ABC-type branched-subunit amino acid transport system substrate-binding protein